MAVTKGIRLHKQLAMGSKPAVAKGPSTNSFNYGNAGQGSIPGTSKKLPSTMPSALKLKLPKGAK